MASKYAKRHYEDVAAILKERHHMAGTIHTTGGGHDEATMLITGTVNAFAHLFAEDNPRFDMERFLTACDEPYPDHVR